MVEPFPRAFVIGYPVAHSLSPDLHGFWLRRYGIRGSYEKIEVPTENLEEFLKNLQTRNFVGGNVTIPHKEMTYQIVKNRNQSTTRLEAVNTLWVENNILMAGNTDSYGFAANMDDFVSGWRDAKTAMVLGAGGASRAVVLALINAGFEQIFIANRTTSRAIVLVDKMGSRCTAVDWDDIPTCLKQIQLLINTTSLGMKGQHSLEIDLSNLPKSAIVSDIVYNPLNTQLLEQARLLGLESVDGIGMLLHQAVPGFEKWFGLRPKVTDELRKFVLDRLSGDAM
ncbi:MAG: shikimate dehydrogenase [Hyphomicrobiales bacterium]|nr:shikimate dehydrogenase [Hyphomicrobiales bacterium]